MQDNRIVIMLNKTEGRGVQILAVLPQDFRQILDCARLGISLMDTPEVFGEVVNRRKSDLLAVINELQGAQPAQLFTEGGNCYEN